MSDSMRNGPMGDQGNSGRMSDESSEQRTNYEGFEGMNYEQIRQPFNPQHNESKRNGAPDSPEGSGRKENA